MGIPLLSLAGFKQSLITLPINCSIQKALHLPLAKAIGLVILREHL